MHRWRVKAAFAAAGIAGMIALPSWAQEGEYSSCEEACYQAVEDCYAACGEAEDMEACETNCQEQVELCLQECE